MFTQPRCGAPSTTTGHAARSPRWRRSAPPHRRTTYEPRDGSTCSSTPPPSDANREFLTPTVPAYTGSGANPAHGARA